MAAGSREGRSKLGAAGGPHDAPRSVVVVPWHPHPASEEERLSLRSIHRFTAGTELVVATPDASSIPPHLTPSRVEVFPAAYFETFLANNRLMTSEVFYARFEGYDQMLFVHADTLLLKPVAPLLETLYPWSYVGAPWIGRRPDGSLFLEAVGNGGFSIRRVPDFLDALRGSSRPSMPKYTTKRKGLALWLFLLVCDGLGISRERVSHFMNRHEILEDVYWSKVAQSLSRRFTVAPIDQARAFSYEAHPAYVHEQNGGTLPYGVHAWWRFDAAFVRQLGQF